MTPRILVADDSVTIQKVVELTFSKEDFQIIRAMNGVEAIAKAKANIPDLILLDVLMPEKNGYEVCESLRKDPQLKDIPIILLVAAFEAFDKERSLRSGADDYVTKPFESKQLIAKVKQHLFARSAKMAPERDIAKEEIPEILTVLPPKEATPPPTPLGTVPVDISTEKEAILGSEEVLEEITEEIEVEKPFWAMEAEIMTPAVGRDGAEMVPSAAEKEGEGKEGEGVSDEELWHMLDLSSVEAAPLPSSPKMGESELTVASEDSAEAFFDLYSQDASFEAPPEPTTRMQAEEPLTGTTVGEEALGLEKKEKVEEVISFENLGEAVFEEEVAVLAEQGGPSKEEEEKKALPPPLAEEVPGAKDEFDSLIKSQVSEVSVEGFLSEELMVEMANRIVKEVSDRLVSRIEKIIWEVVPDLAEALITKEIERIKRAAEEQETS